MHTFVQLMPMTNASSCPIHHGAADPDSGPVLPGKGATDYERYMHVDELLALQKPHGELAHPDEVLFQTIHQSWELWCNLVCFELARVADLMDEDRWATAVRLLRRCRKAIHANTAALAVFDTMTPRDFHEVRRQLGAGSGAESPGFRRIQSEAPQLWPRVEALLEREGVDLEGLYMKQGLRPDLFLLLEAMTDLDQEIYQWREVHLAVVKRIIGRDVKSLKGYAVHQLEEDIHQMRWPKLWQVRERITDIEGTSPA